STRTSSRAQRNSIMPRVVISGQAARRFTGGQTEFEGEANNFRRMVLELDRRFPGLGRQIEESMAVAIDGEIFQDAYLAPPNPESEISLIPKIGAGGPGREKRCRKPKPRATNYSRWPICSRGRRDWP